MKSLKGSIVTAKSIIEGEIFFDSISGKIKKIEKKKVKNKKIILPGFIDLHLHGGGGRDIMEAGDVENAASTIARIHARHGTTSFLATTMTAPKAELARALTGLKYNYLVRGKSEGRILGVHLEGPFINADKLGAQPNVTRPATLEEIKKLNSLVPLKVITLAPELLHDHALIKDLQKLGLVVQLGHSNATYEEGLKAMDSGAKSFTHLFNAMSGFHHRAPGLAGTALAHAEYAEMILDLQHVHPGAFKTALRAIPKLYFVTDATAASGMPDGDYKLGSQTVHKCLGGVRLKDGTLAGSCLTMHQAFKNALGLGLPLLEASRRASLYPAELIGEKLRGQLGVKFFADMLVMDMNFQLEKVFVEGEEI